MMARFAVALVCALSAALPAFGERITLRPVDQAERDPALAGFRASLRQIVKDRNTPALLAATCPAMQPEIDPLSKDPAAWQALETTLSEPGFFADPAAFWMPYHWQFSLPAGIDPATAYIVNGTGVRMRARASQSARVLTALTYEVVSAPAFTGPRAYQNITLGDGTTGFVWGRYLTPLLGPRAKLERATDGTWHLCLFDRDG